ncbi:MAG: hypothetical protein H6658_05920 [Ardenticatenaceae bacterium]|nr:hypothetical protein [Ardenticatenaceae bacterium]
MDELPQKFPCPNCFVSVPMPDTGEAVTCVACGETLVVLGHLCADCGTYHAAAVPLCEECGAPLARVCRRCRTLNWAGSSHCAACGAGLDVLETLLHHSTEGTTAVAQQQMRESHTIKWQEELHSAQRMEKLNEKEAARQAELRRREQILAKQKQQMWMKTAVVVALVILLVVVAALLS